MKQEPSDVLCFECDHGLFMHGKYIYCLKKHGILHFTKKTEGLCQLFKPCYDSNGKCVCSPITY